MTRCFSQRTKMKGDDEGSLPMANIAFCLNQREDRQKKRNSDAGRRRIGQRHKLHLRGWRFLRPSRARSEDTHAGIPTPSWIVYSWCVFARFGWNVVRRLLPSCFVIVPWTVFFFTVSTKSTISKNKVWWSAQLLRREAFSFRTGTIVSLSWGVLRLKG